MKSITTKLFFAFLALTICVLLFSLGLAWWGVSIGFSDYRRSLEMGRLKVMHDPVVELYQDYDSQWPKDIERHFERIVYENLPHKTRKKGRRDADPKKKKGPRGPESDRRFDEGRHRPPPRRSGGFDSKTALFDQNGRFLAGWNVLENEFEHVTLELISNGKKIGEIKASLGLQALNLNNEEEDFIEKQAWSSLFIALIALLLAGLTSWRISRVFLTPIYQLRSHVNQLSNGKYDKRLKSEQKDELGDLIIGVNRLASTLEENRSSRKRWIADVSHELRTPVTVLMGEVEAMLDGIREVDIEGVRSLKHEIERISLLVDDLYQLSLSEMGGLRYEYESIDVAEIVVSVVRGLKPKIDDKGLSLELNIHDKLKINGDPNRIEQLLSNLLNNSIAYTDSPGTICITSSIDNERSITIVFEDSAPAVNKTDIDHLFEPLYRSDESRNRRTGGAGLGMSICKNIVDAHDGHISASLSTNGGLRVMVILPINRETSVA